MDDPSSASDVVRYGSRQLQNRSGFAICNAQTASLVSLPSPFSPVPRPSASGTSSPSSYLASGMSACSPPPAAWSIGLFVGAAELVGHFLERGVREDQLDHLALDDLVPQHVHRAALLQPGPHAARRLAALGGDQPNLGLVILLVGVDLLVLGDALEDEVFLQRPGRARPCCSAAGRSRGRGFPRR